MSSNLIACIGIFFLFVFKMAHKEEVHSFCCVSSGLQVEQFEGTPTQGQNRYGVAGGLPPILFS